MLDRENGLRKRRHQPGGCRIRISTGVFMDIFSIIMLYGGLAMFLYGMEVMSDGLKNASGNALKRVLEKVTSNVVMGVLTGTLVTAVIQS
jgi:hypothetical protein